MARIVLDYKKNIEESKVIGQGDIIVMEHCEWVSSYIVFVKCGRNESSQKMLVSLEGGAGVYHYDNLGNMTHKQLKDRFPKCKITIIPRDEAIIKIDKINS